MAKAIKVESLSKAYQLGDFGTGTITRDFERMWARVRGKDDPFLKIGEVNDRTIKGKSDVVWSLKDLNFEIEQGDAVGIIGRNGAGKSTLLKILSRVTSPTTGSVKIKGRVASLLEVGTGFHPELTGRENIYLNGAILGMRNAEIKRKFDEIVDFSGVERYIDTPVKRYSSGMYVRLAFAVAAHLESEILIVDEVLAVGDADFQKKCLGKIGEVSKGEGRTVLFVSHNMRAVQQLCSEGILLTNGHVTFAGAMDDVVNNYLFSDYESKSVYHIPLTDIEKNSGYVYRLNLEDIDGNLLSEIPIGRPWQIRVYFKLHQRCKDFIIGLGMSNSMEVAIRTSWSIKTNLEAGLYEAIFKEEQLLFAEGNYHLAVGLTSNESIIFYKEKVASITISNIIDRDLDTSIIRTVNVGQVLNPMNIIIKANN